MKSLRFSLRYLSKARNGNITRVVSLTLGLAVSLLIFSYVGFLLSFDRCFPDRDRIYQVWGYSDLEGMGFFEQQYYPLAPELKQFSPHIEVATRVWGISGIEMKVEENKYDALFWGVDTSFCDVFGIKELIGEDPHQIFTSKDKIMISQSLAKSAFPNQDPVGQRVRVYNNIDVTVAGVFEDMPSNTSLSKFNMLVPLELVIKVTGMYAGWNGGDSFPTFIKLKEGARIEDVEAVLPAFIDKFGFTDKVAEWHLQYMFYPITGVSFIEGSNKSMVYILSALTFILLFVAAMNYVLVSISGMVRRSRTIALLKCNGAHKNDIFHIFLWETAVLVVCALALAVLIILACANPIEQLTSYPVAELFSWKRIWAPAVVLIAAFLMAGLIPARLFTKVPVEAAFKGLADANRIWKKVLLGVEIGCVTCVGAMLWVSVLQFRFMRYGNFGYEPDNLVYTMFKGNPSQFEKYVHELEALPEVKSVGHSYSLPIYGYSGQPCVDENTHKILFSCRWEAIDKYYIPAMEMKIVEGTNFNDETRPFDVIVNRKYVKLRGWEDNPVGKQIIDREGDNPDIYTIVGVVDNFRTEWTCREQPIVIHPLSMLMTKENGNYGNVNTMIRLQDMSQESLAVLSEKIKGYESYNDYTITVYNDLINNVLSQIRSIRNVIAVGTVFTLLIALIGLLGYLSDECNRRAREVAVRKVNGATVRDILALLARNTIVLVLISIAAGLVAAYFAADLSMQALPYRVPFSWWIFAATAAIVVVLVYAIQGVKTWRTANSNPSAMLKAE